jgi:uncharacterized membrane protein HdeD (DUF308 family)
MQLKSYDKSWLPAFKGAFLILFGLISILFIFGTIKTLAVFFIALIGMMAILLIGSGVMFKNSKFRPWTFAMGIINLTFAISLAIHMDDSGQVILWIILFWVIFYAICEVVEAGILIALKNAFFALYLLNACLTFLFGYFLYQLKGNFNERSVYFVGLIALVFGVANVLSAYLLSRIKDVN